MVDNNLKAYSEKGKSPVDDHEGLAKESWHPIKKSASNIETNADRRYINGNLAQTKQKLRVTEQTKIFMMMKRRS